MIDVTVSIVNHESRDDVLASLRALEDDATRARSLQVIVVDNASRDGSAEAFTQAFPQVELIARRTRGGYGANHNLALARADGAYVLFLNDDAVALLEQAGFGQVDVHPRYWVEGAALRRRERLARTPLRPYLAPQNILTAVKA